MVPAIFSRLSLVVALVLSSARSHGDGYLPIMSCSSVNSTCPINFCCVKRVITYADVSRHAIGYEECQPLRKYRNFCLVKTEGFMCPCSKGLTCKNKANENFGYCEATAEK